MSVSDSQMDRMYATIQERIKVKEIEVSEVLKSVKEKYQRELHANIDYHLHLAKVAEESADSNQALRHQLLADIYKSMLERA